VDYAMGVVLEKLSEGWIRKAAVPVQDRGQSFPLRMALEPDGGFSRPFLPEPKAD
jgi:hypothetical protein